MKVGHLHRGPQGRFISYKSKGRGKAAKRSPGRLIGKKRLYKDTQNESNSSLVRRGKRGRKPKLNDSEFVSE